jgi:hypothetical protein
MWLEVSTIIAQVPKRPLVNHRARIVPNSFLGEKWQNRVGIRLGFLIIPKTFEEYCSLIGNVERF